MHEPVRGTPRIRIIQTARQWGGVEHNNTQLALHLAKRGVSVAITAIGQNTYSKMPDEYAEALNVEEIPWPHDPYRCPPTFRDWRRIMRKRGADIAVFPKSYWCKGGIAMMAAARLSYRRVIVREEGAPQVPPRVSKRHCMGLIPGVHWWYLKHVAYGRALSAVPDKIICVSDITRTRLIDDCGYPPSKTVTVHNAVDTGRYRNDAVARSGYRKEIGIPADALVVGAVGRIDNIHKRHDLSLRAFARAMNECPDTPLYFLLVGEGPDRQTMRDLAAALGIASRVVFAPFTATPWRAHCALDIFMMPSCSESFGIAMIEAMACERVVIGNAVEGISEILTDPAIGFTCDIAESDGLYRALQAAILMGSAGRRAMGLAARMSVVDRFDADVQYGRVIQHVLGRVASSQK